MSLHRPTTTDPKRRSGAVLLAVLVCLGIASAITASAIRTSLRARRHMDAQWQLEQTRQLLDAGIRHTRQAARDEPDYAGESFNLDNTFDAYPYARIDIKPVSSETTAGGAGQPLEVVATLRNRDATTRQTRRSQIVQIRTMDVSSKLDSTK